MALAAPTVAGQEERPQITPGERKVPRKKDAGPRALAVLQVAANGKTSLVPIAILISGKFWDAAAYKASPVPMALEPGTVYEAERSGSSQGLFTVNTALHSNAVNSPTPWIGTGAYVAAGSEPEKKPLKAEGAPAGIDTLEGPPRLTKNPAAGAPAPPPASNRPASPSSAPPSSSPSSGDEPPRLSKPSAPSAPPAPSPGTPQGDSKGTAGSAPPGSSQTGSGQPGSAGTGTPGTKSGNKPDATKDAPAQEPASDSGADVGNRPRLRRGKPAESFADEDVAGYSRPGIRPSTSAVKAAPAAAAEPVRLIPAISDAGGPEPHSYGFEWLKDEEGQRKDQMIDLAKEQVSAYVQARAKARIAPKSSASVAKSPALHHTAAKKGPEPILSNVQMTAYDLWSDNRPVLVFSAQAEMPPAVQGAAGPADNLQYSVLLVAYPDMYNNLRKLYAGVTDKYHLDLTPSLELVDAVDADGDGRGELLFRQTTDAGRGWVIYRATADKLWKMYDSLNPE
jgi:hypothetical protein